MTFDPLTSHLGHWSLTGMRPRQDEDSAYEYVCCGAPVEAHHLDSCPQSSIWAEMCAEYGNALHVWAFMPLETIDVTHADYVQRWYWFHSDELPSRWLLLGPGDWRLPESAYDRVKGQWQGVFTDEYIRRQRLRPISDVLSPLLNDADLCIPYRRSPEPNEAGKQIGDSLQALNPGVDQAKALAEYWGVSAGPAGAKGVPMDPAAGFGIFEPYAVTDKRWLDPGAKIHAAPVEMTPDEWKKVLGDGRIFSIAEPPTYTFIEPTLPPDAFERVCAVLDGARISLLMDPLWPYEPPHGLIYPDDIGPLARKIMEALMDTEGQK